MVTRFRNFVALPSAAIPQSASSRPNCFIFVWTKSSMADASLMDSKSTVPSAFRAEYNSARAHPRLLLKRLVAVTRENQIALAAIAHLIEDRQRGRNERNAVIFLHLHSGDRSSDKHIAATMTATDRRASCSTWSDFPQCTVPRTAEKSAPRLSQLLPPEPAAPIAS